MLKCYIYFFLKSSDPRLHMMIHSCDLRTQEEEVEEFEVSLGYTERTYLKNQNQNQNLNINTISLICNWAQRSINICIQCCSKTTATQWGMLKTKRIMTKKRRKELGLVTHTCNPHSQKTKAGGLPKVWDQPELQRQCQDSQGCIALSKTKEN